jgi:hypothetical protein
VSAKIGLASWSRTAFNGVVMGAGMALLWWWRAPAGCDVGDLLINPPGDPCHNAPWLLICYAVFTRGVLLLGEIAVDEISRRRADKR